MTALYGETAHNLTTRLSEELTRREGERLKWQVIRNLVSSTDVLATVILAAWSGSGETLGSGGFRGPFVGPPMPNVVGGDRLDSAGV